MSDLAAAGARAGGGSPPRPWLAFGVSVAVLLVEVVMLDRLVGDEMLGITLTLFGRRFFRREALLAVLAALAVFQAEVRHDLPEFRLATLSPRRLAGHATAFVALFAFLAAMGRAVPQSAIGDLPTACVAAGLTLAWLVSLTLLLPPRVQAARTIGGPLFVAAVLELGIAVADVGTKVFWNLTSDTTTRIVAWVITPFAGGTVVRPEASVVGTQAFSVHIAAECSGWHGVLLVTSLFMGYLWWFRRLHRFPHALLLFPIGVVLISMANVVRIAALILVGIWISPTIAVDGFHSQAGWVAFLVVGLGLIWAVGRIPFFLAEPDVALAPGGAAAPTLTGATFGPSVDASLLPFMALLVTTIATGLFSAHDFIDVLYPARVVAVAAVLWGLRHEFRWREASLSPAAVGLGVAVFAMWMLLAPMSADSAVVASQDPTQLGPVWGTLWLVVRMIGYTVTVPIAEELAFRGFLARRLISLDVERVEPGTFSWPSFLGSSLAFGALHQAAWIPGTLAGMAFAAALYRRRRLGDAIVAHATTNALLSVYVIGTGSWASWG